LTNILLTEDILKELESLYNYVDESELTVSYNRLELLHLLIYNIIK